MDTSDPRIEFDSKGTCNHCRDYDAKANKLHLSSEAKKSALDKLIHELKSGSSSRSYDCVIGVSGGVDSTYVAHLVKQYGLKPLAVHVDNGWNAELAVGNIERTLNACGIDLYTRVLDWNEFRDLQLSFLKAATPDSEIPTDHAIVATLFELARKEGIKHVIAGTNTATEAVMPPSWSQGHADWRYIKGVHQRFGKRPIRSYPHYDLVDLFRFADSECQHRFTLAEISACRRQKRNGFVATVGNHVTIRAER